MKRAPFKPFWRCDRWGVHYKIVVDTRIWTGVSWLPYRACRIIYAAEWEVVRPDLRRALLMDHLEVIASDIIHVTESYK